MKYVVFSIAILGALIFTPPASADWNFRHGYDRFYDFGFYGRDRFRGYRHYQNRFPNRFGRYHRPWGYGGSYWDFSVGRRYRHGRFDNGALLGGIVLGSVLGHSVANARYERRYTRPRATAVVPVPRTSSVRVISRSPAIIRSSTTPTRLLRDLSGRCYEIATDGAGNETRTEVDAAVCNF